MNTIKITNSNPQEINITGGGQVFGITAVYQNNKNVTEGNSAYVTVPTKVSQLENDNGYLTRETDPTVPNIVKTITANDINNWNSKQNQLISGSTIKTINNISLLGSGNISVGGSEYTAGTGISIDNGVINNTLTSYNDLTDLPSIPTKTSDLVNDSNFVQSDELANVAFSGSYLDLIDQPVIPQNTSDLVNDSNFAYTTVTNTFTADQEITGNLIVTGNQNANKFSTSEIINGKWINDSILYRKTISITLPNNTSTTINTGLIDENVINIFGFVKSGTIVYPVNINNSTTQISTYYNNGNLVIEDNCDGTNYSGYVTLEYYKS